MPPCRKRKKSKLEADECDSIPCIPTTPRKLLKSEEIENDACRCPVSSTDEDYKMNHKKRGRAIIFNHYMCHGHSQPRRGTQCDVMRLEKALKNILKFDVHIHKDLKHCEIMEVLQNVSNENFCHEDCLAVFVLTHGNLNTLTAADETYALEELWQHFTPPNCASLAGKPKLFFINSCRGKKFDEGVCYENRDAGAVTKDADSNKCVSYRAPIYADFLMFYSSMEGYTSLRHPVLGTWFIQSLCETLENKNYAKLELKQILTITTRKTGLKCNQYSETVCQIPTMMSTLMRNVYFCK